MPVLLALECGDRQIPRAHWLAGQAKGQLPVHLEPLSQVRRKERHSWVLRGLMHGTTEAHIPTLLHAYTIHNTRRKEGGMEGEGREARKQRRGKKDSGL